MSTPFDPAVLPVRRTAAELEALPPQPVPPYRWHGALFPLGVPSPGGVTVWHPDHVGMTGAELDADVPVPVGLEAVVPLLWNTALTVDGPGDDGGAGRLGVVDAVWLEGGVLHVRGGVNRSARLNASVATYVRDERETGRRLSLKAQFAGLTYPERDGAPDYFSVIAWRLRAVQLGRPGLAGWPAPFGEVHWIGADDPVPGPAISVTPS